jgi:hypothetical protein
MKKQQPRQLQQNRSKRPPAQEVKTTEAQSPSQAGLQNLAQLDGLEACPSSQSIRQATLLQMQQQHGNVSVQRMLSNKLAIQKSESNGLTGKANLESATEEADTQIEAQQQLRPGLSEDALHKLPEPENVQSTDRAETANDFEAQAFTQGKAIHLNDGVHNPNSSAGKRLLAHELTHTIQKASSVQARPQKPEFTSPLEARPALGANRVAPGVPAARVVPVSARPGVASIARKKAPATPFAGSAGVADVRAGEAGAGAGGISPIHVSTEYTTQQAERKDKQMHSFRTARIPFVRNNQEHYAYKKLTELRQEYINDVPRISLGEGAFNDFVVPGTLAHKSTAQFKQLQFELGYFDDMDPSEDLTAKERDVLANKLDEEEMHRLNADIRSKEQTAGGLRKEILGTSHKIQAAMQQRAGILALEAKGKAEKDKAAIEEKIKAVKAGAETVGSVIKAVSFAGFGGPAAVKAIGAGGAGAIKGGLDLGEKGTSLIGATAEFIMTQMYEEDIQKAKQEIAKAKVAEEHAKKMDAELRLTGSMLTIEGQLEQLQGAMGALSLALKARKNYFAKLGSESDKATGKKSGGKMSQYLAYVSQANETKSHIDGAKASANSATSVMNVQISQMSAHRNESYVADAEGVWGNRRYRDGDGPDLRQLIDARNAVNGFIKSADKQLEVINQVISSLPAPK